MHILCNRTASLCPITPILGITIHPVAVVGYPEPEPYEAQHITKSLLACVLLRHKCAEWRKTIGETCQYPQIFTSHPYVPASSSPKQPGRMDREREIGAR